MDQRIIEHAKILVDYSTKVKPNDMVLIRYNDYGLDLAKAVYKVSVERGAHPIIQQTPTDALRALYENMPEEYLNKLPVHELATFSSADVVIAIRGEDNVKALASIDKTKIAARSTATRAIQDTYLKKRWVLTQAPSQAYAQEAEMSTEEYENFVFSSVLRDWKAEEKKLKGIEGLLDKTDKVTIEGKETNLTFSIKGRKAVSGNGEHNMPDGEVFTSIVDDSAEGKIYFDLPGIRYGNEVRDVYLIFSKGEVTNYSASKGEDLLKAMIESDDKKNRGSRRLGELGIGTNYGIKKFTKNILFDEKIGGTVHLALGNAYPECGGKNQSSIHWDLIKTMKPGKMLFDGELVYEDGIFTVPLE